jgi:hypothetical protein
MKIMKAAVFAAAFLLAMPGFDRAQIAAVQERLFKEIESLDGRLFDAYNRCDLEKMAAQKWDLAALPRHQL